MVTPAVNINEFPKAYQKRFNFVDQYSYCGNNNGLIDSDEEAQAAAEKVCEEDYRQCLAARNDLRQKGFVLAEKDGWQRRPLPVKDFPQYQPYLQKGDQEEAGIFEPADGVINSDNEMRAALEACSRDSACNSRQMAQDLLPVRGPVVERALVFSFSYDVGFGFSDYYYTSPIDPDKFDVPTHPEDTSYGRASGPIEVGDKLEDYNDTRPRYGLKLDLWQYFFVRYMRGDQTINVPTCVLQQYANDYDAFTAACFRLRKTNYFSLGFYPYIKPYQEREYIGVLPFDLMLGNDMGAVTRMKYGGFQVAAEAGIVTGEFSYDFGWHRWGQYEFDKDRAQRDMRYGFTAQVSGRFVFPNAGVMTFGFPELGLATDVFPGRHYSVMITAAVSLGAILHTYRRPER